MLGKTNKVCFNPSVVSTGPYHHGKHNLQEVEKLKLKLAKQYSNGPRPGGPELFGEVKKVASTAREFYDNKALTYLTDDAFTKMMFIDGCFIMQFMCLLAEEKYHAMRMKNDVIDKVKQDLFLVENQLPYIVLKELMVKKGSEEKWNKLFYMFIIVCQRFPPVVKSWQVAAGLLFNRSPLGAKSIPLHLLDMTRTRFLIHSATKEGSKTTERDTNDGYEYHSRKFNLLRPNDWYSYYSASVLKSKGIKFRPNKIGSFSDAKFESFIRGVLTLPPIFMDASTKPMLLNLLAFESSHYSSTNMSDVTSYVCFMDLLIDHVEDVMILRSHNVIVNCLGNDQLVADLFNDTASNFIPNTQTYAEAKRGIQKHCNNKVNKWMAECLQTHGRNPWTLIASFGAILVIMLSVVQTYLTARPSKP